VNLATKIVAMNMPAKSDLVLKLVTGHWIVIKLEMLEAITHHGPMAVGGPEVPLLSSSTHSFSIQSSEHIKFLLLRPFAIIKPVRSQ
jgi:hypothetical protein